MKKMIYILIIIIVGALIIVAPRIAKHFRCIGIAGGECGPDITKVWDAQEAEEKSQAQMERECRADAESTHELTARIDRETAAEERFYLCLIQKGADPYKYSWTGKGISDSMKQFIKEVIEVTENKKNKILSSPNIMTVSFNGAGYLKETYHASDVFTPSSEEVEKSRKLLGDAINAISPEKNAWNYQVQMIGMTVAGTKKIYAYAWSDGNVYMTYTDKQHDPKTEFFSPIVTDGGDEFIDAVIDLETGKIDTLKPHNNPSKTSGSMGAIGVGEDAQFEQQIKDRKIHTR